MNATTTKPRPTGRPGDDGQPTAPPFVEWPHDLDGEQALLGSMMLDDGRAIPDVLAILPAGKSWFFVREHEDLYRVLADLHDKGKPIDLAILRDDLTRRGIFEKIGGVEYLVQLVQSVPSAVNAGYYAEIVADKANLRDIKLAALDTIRAVEGGGVSAVELVRDARERIEELAQDAGDETTARGIRVLSVPELLAMPVPEWQLSPVVPKQSLVVVYGPSESGKSFIVQDICLSVASGRDWLGRYPLEQGPTVYIAGEGQARVRQRVQAWLTWHNLEPDALAEFRCVPESVNLASLDEVDRLYRTVEAGTNGKAPSIVAVDTLARCLTGDENSAEDMGAFIGGCERLQARFGCSVVVVHHAGWNQSRERGSSALRGAADMKFRVEQSGQLITLSCDKAKDFERPAPIYLRRTVVALPDGGSSCIIQPHDGARLVLSDFERQVLGYIQQHPSGMRFGQCKRAFAPTVMSERTFAAVLRRLVQQGLALKTGEGKDTRYYPGKTCDDGDDGQDVGAG